MYLLCLHNFIQLIFVEFEIFFNSGENSFRTSVFRLSTETCDRNNDFIHPVSSSSKQSESESFIKISIKTHSKMRGEKNIWN